MILYQFVYFKKNYTSPTDFVQNFNKLIYLPIRLLSIVSIFCTFAEPTWENNEGILKKEVKLMELNADMLLQFVVNCNMDTVKQQMLWVLFSYW